MGRGKLVLGALVSLSFLAVSVQASQEVLRAPLAHGPNARLAQGWHYTWGAAHKALDYYVVDDQGDWISFEVVAAYDGELECYAPGSPGYSASMGTMCAVYHEVNGIQFVSLYAHLESFVPPVDTRVPVSAGEFIGMAGKTGLANDVIHLHFELHEGPSVCYACRVDPYDIYAVVDSYPALYDGQSGLLGQSHWWANDPPQGFGGGESETCTDGIENQMETGVDCGGPCPPCPPPECSDGDRRRCWVECPQNFPENCIRGLTPTLMGIETCAGRTWGACDVNDVSCDEIDDPCTHNDEFLISYECIDETTRDGYLVCSTQLGAGCMTAFYQGWPPKDCPEDLCLTLDDGCPVDGQERACDVYCGGPGGPIVAGTQECVSYCGNNLAWSPCDTHGVCTL